MLHIPVTNPQSFAYCVFGFGSCEIAVDRKRCKNDNQTQYLYHRNSENLLHILIERQRSGTVYRERTFDSRLRVVAT